MRTCFVSEGEWLFFPVGPSPPKPGRWQRTFSFITSKANRLIEGIQDRMPTILDDRTAEDWMNPGERNLLRLKSLLVAAPDDNLVLSLASSTVNRVNNAGLELLVPVRTISVRRS